MNHQFFILAFWSAATSFSASATESIHGSPDKPILLTIDSQGFRRLTIAIPPFTTAKPSPLSSRAAKRLEELLEFSGLFSALPQAALPRLESASSSTTRLLTDSVEPGLQGVDFEQWRKLNVEALTLANLSEQGNLLELEIRTIDIGQRKLITAKKYSKFSEVDLESVLRRYGDQILQGYTGKPGIFASKIAFVGRKTKQSQKQIFICDFDGSNLQQITKIDALHLSPAWSLDGRHITYTSYQDGNPDLFMYNLASKSSRKIASSKGINSGARWSSDNQIIAFTGSDGDDTNIFTMDPLSTNGRQQLISGNGLDVDPSFSPDRQWLAFVSGRFGNPHIFRAKLSWAGPKSVRVTEEKRLTYAGWYNASPEWSPDSQKIAFAGYDKDIDRFDLFLMNGDGTNMERLTLKVGDNENPSWSPNGELITFESNRVGTQNIKGASRIFMMNRDGTSQRMIDIPLFDAQTPNWSKQIP